MRDRDSVTQALKHAGCVAPGEEADELMRAAAGDPEVLDELVARRAGGEPLAWLTGSVIFCDIDLFVSPGVYVPRWQTEPLARRAVSLLPPAGVAVDLCTGAGAIAAVLAAAVPTAQVCATEVDRIAVRCARRNGVEVFEGFLEDPLPRELASRVDVLTAVVPYVPTDALRLLPRDVRAFEPTLALDGGVDGTDLLVEVARRSTRWQIPGGWLLLELGGEQAGPMGQRALHPGDADCVLAVAGPADELLDRLRGFADGCDLNRGINQSGHPVSMSARALPTPAHRTGRMVVPLGIQLAFSPCWAESHSDTKPDQADVPGVGSCGNIGSGAPGGLWRRLRLLGTDHR